MEGHTSIWGWERLDLRLKKWREESKVRKPIWVRSLPGRLSRLSLMAWQTTGSEPDCTACVETSITKKKRGGIGGRTCAHTLQL